jgi:hypothetical protein
MVPLDLNTRMRAWHQVERGRMRAFTIQLEVLFESQWMSVVRYDTAHNFAHRDLYTKEGRQFKTPLEMNFSQARTFAQRDILMNWQEYRRIFLQE